MLVPPRPLHHPAPPAHPRPGRRRASRVAGALGGGVAEHLSSGGFDDPTSESSQAAGPARGALRHRHAQPRAARHRRRAARSTTPPSPRAGADAHRPAGGRAAAWPTSRRTGASARRRRCASTDATQALVVARIDGRPGRGRRPGRRARRRADRRRSTAATVEVGGLGQVFHEVGDHDRARPRAGRDDRAADHDPPAAVHLPRRGRRRAAARHRRARRSSARSSCCGCSPSFTEVSIFALNLTTAMGLGLAIDYSLFVVSRYREELAAGLRAARRGRAHRAHRRADGRLQRPDRRRVAVRAARLPARPSCGRSPTRASRSPSSPASARSSCCPPCSPCSATGSTRCRCAASRPKPVDEGIWHRIAIDA